MKYLMLVITLLIFVSCDSSYEIGEKIKKMESSPIKVEYSSMSCWLNDSLLNERPWELEKGLKLVTFTDSSLCSVCNIKKMYLWNKIIELESKYEKFNIVFILGVKRGATSYISTQLYQSGINHPIYLDESQSLLTQNPQIPKEPMYHTFLLDESNNIILVGNPTSGEHIEKMLFDILDEKLGKQTKNLNSK